MSHDRNHARRQCRQLEHQVSVILGLLLAISSSGFSRDKSKESACGLDWLPETLKEGSSSMNAGPAEVATVPAALDKLVAFLRERIGGRLPAAIGHRVVHGGPDYSEPTVVNEDVLDRLERVVAPGPPAPAQQSRSHPRDARAAAAAATGRMLRHGLPSRPSRGRRPLRHSRAALCGGRSPLRIPRPFL